MGEWDGPGKRFVFYFKSDGFFRSCTDSGHCVAINVAGLYGELGVGLELREIRDDTGIFWDFLQEGLGG